MFDKEEELVEIGSHSYNLKPGGEGGWDYVNETITDEQKKKRSISGMIRTEQILKEKYGPNWRSKIGSIAGKKSVKIQRINNTGLFNPEIREMGRIRANSIESREKRKRTCIQIKHQQGVNNSQYGTMWITDGMANRKIKKDDVIPEGWRKGRKVLSVA